MEAEASRIAHYQAGKLVDGDVGGFVAQMARSAASQVLSRANASVPAAASRRGEPARYARVLRGPEPCGWCFILAAKGFEYNSAEAASHSHRGCRCVVVPGEEGGSIGGYDMKGMRDRYDSVVSALPHGSTDGEIAAALELRDPGWLFDGHVSGFDIPTAKLTRYALCRTNQNGGADKARAFRKYLGYGSDDWMEVASNVYAHVSGNGPTHTFSDEYGERFQSDFVMDGKDGRKARVRVGRIKRPDDMGLQLVSIMVKER